MTIREEAITSTTAHFSIKAVQKIVLVSLLIVIPLGLNLWGQHPFVLPKVLLLRTLVWLLATLALVDYWLHGRSLRRGWQTNPLIGAVALLALVIIVTTVTAVNWRLSFWGSLERGQGALTLLTYLLLFLLTANYCRSLERVRWLLTAMVLTAVPLVFISFLQAVGWDPFGLLSDARSPLYATLGRANFLAAYLAMLVPLTLALLLTTEDRYGRLGWALLVAAELLVIGFTLARGAWLATIFVLCLFTFLWWEPQLSRFWRWLGRFCVGLLFCSGPLLVWLGGQARLGSTAARLAIWQGTLTLIKQRPLLGYGADSLGIAFPRVYAPELVYYQGRDYFVDRAHNLFLDWAVSAGLPGLLAFSLVLIMFVWVMTKALHQPQPTEQRWWLIAILAAVLGNVANNLVSFEVTPTAMAFWVLTGMGVALTLSSVDLITKNLSEKPQSSRRSQRKSLFSVRPYWRWLVVALLFMGWGVAVWQGNGRLLLADVALRAADLQAKAGNWEEAAVAAEWAITYWPIEPAYQLRLSQAYWQQAATTSGATPQLLAQAEIALETAVQLRPQDPNLWLQMAQFYAVGGTKYGRDTQSLANHAYQQALSLAPNHATIYTAWGRTHLENNNPQTAAALLRQAVQLDASNGEAYIYLGAAELALGRLTAARDDYREAVRLLPQSSVAHAGLAECYWQLNQPHAAWQATERALQHDPHNNQALILQQTINAAP